MFSISNNPVVQNYMQENGYTLKSLSNNVDIENNTFKWRTSSNKLKNISTNKINEFSDLDIDISNTDYSFINNKVLKFEEAVTEWEEVYDEYYGEEVSKTYLLNENYNFNDYIGKYLFVETDPFLMDSNWLDHIFDNYRNYVYMRDLGLDYEQELTVKLKYQNITRKGFLFKITEDFLNKMFNGNYFYITTVYGNIPNFYLTTFSNGDEVSPEFGEAEIVANDANNPLTLSEIKSMISAWDEVDGNVTASIKVVEDNYSANKNKVGTFTIKFSAEDSSGNIAYLTLYITNVDKVAPVFSGTSTYTIGNNETLDLTTVKNGLIANDLVDGSCTISLKTDNYTTNKNKIGTHSVIYEARDLSGNTATYTVYIKVLDKVTPIIKGTNSYTQGNNQKLSLDTIKAGLTATDDVDGNLTTSITLKTDNYSAHYSKVGTYTIIYTVSDEAGNSCDYPITVKVVDKIAPIIKGTNTYTQGNNQKISVESIKASLTASDDTDGNLTTSITLKADNYSNKFNNVGSHKVVFTVSDKAGNVSDFTVTINVVDNIAPVLSGPTSIDKAYNLSLTLDDILQQFTVTDETSNLTWKNISVVRDDYSLNSNTPGSYVIHLQVKDGANNYSEIHTLTINVIDDIPPVFIVSGVINVKQSLALSQDDLINILKIKGVYDETTDSLTVLQNDYVNNENTVGVYDVIYEIANNEGKSRYSFKVKVHGNSEEVNDTNDEETNALDQAITFIKENKNKFIGGGIAVVVLSLVGYIYMKKLKLEEARKRKQAQTRKKSQTKKSNKKGGDAK